MSHEDKSIVIANAVKQSRLSKLDCFAALAMTRLMVSLHPFVAEGSQ